MINVNLWALLNNLYFLQCCYPYLVLNVSPGPCLAVLLTLTCLVACSLLEQCRKDRSRGGAMCALTCVVQPLQRCSDSGTRVSCWGELSLRVVPAEAADETTDEPLVAHHWSG